ncbi:MAG: hypothetical protein ABI361_00805 [Nitrososphaera sp.]
MSSGQAPASVSVAVYGLSTEGYKLASAMAIRGNKVSLIDESVRMAIALKPDIARAYPNVSALREDEPLLDLEPVDTAVSNAAYVFFAPRIRKTGPDSKADVSSKLKDAVKSLKKGSSVLYLVPTGIGGNNENMQLIEHITGLSVSDGKDVSYYYMPAGVSGGLGSSETWIGSVKSKQDSMLARMLHDPDIRRRISFLDLSSTELSHAIRVLSHYTGMASVFEVCKKVAPDYAAGGTIQASYGDIYIDDVASGLYDLRAIGSSLDSGEPLMYLVNGSIRGVDRYQKHLIDQIRLTLRQRELKASKTRVSLAWTLDRNEMRGDKMDLLSSIENKIKDHIGDVERHQYTPAPSFGGSQSSSKFDMYHSDKTTLVLACSKSDYERVSSGPKSEEVIIMKANPLCQSVNA